MKRLSDEAEIDPGDSLICAWSTHMRMGCAHAHAVISCEHEGITTAYWVKTTIWTPGEDTLGTRPIPSLSSSSPRIIVVTRASLRLS
jgi:hypothetical protein